MENTDFMKAKENKTRVLVTIRVMVKNVSDFLDNQTVANIIQDVEKIMSKVLME